MADEQIFIQLHPSNNGIVQLWCGQHIQIFQQVTIMQNAIFFPISDIQIKNTTADLEISEIYEELIIFLSFQDLSSTDNCLNISDPVNTFVFQNEEAEKIKTIQEAHKQQHLDDGITQIPKLEISYDIIKPALKLEFSTIELFKVAARGNFYDNQIKDYMLQKNFFVMNSMITCQRYDKHHKKVIEEQSIELFDKLEHQFHDLSLSVRTINMMNHYLKKNCVNVQENFQLDEQLLDAMQELMDKKKINIRYKSFLTVEQMVCLQKNIDKSNFLLVNKEQIRELLQNNIVKKKYQYDVDYFVPKRNSQNSRMQFQLNYKPRSSIKFNESSSSENSEETSSQDNINDKHVQQQYSQQYEKHKHEYQQNISFQLEQDNNSNYGDQVQQQYVIDGKGSRTYQDDNSSGKDSILQQQNITDPDDKNVQQDTNKKKKQISTKPNTQAASCKKGEQKQLPAIQAPSNNQSNSIIVSDGQQQNVSSQQQSSTYISSFVNNSIQDNNQQLNHQVQSRSMKQEENNIPQQNEAIQQLLSQNNVNVQQNSSKNLNLDVEIVSDDKKDSTNQSNKKIQLLQSQSNSEKDKRKKIAGLKQQKSDKQQLQIKCSNKTNKNNNSIEQQQSNSLDTQQQNKQKLPPSQKLGLPPKQTGLQNANDHLFVYNQSSNQILNIQNINQDVHQQNNIQQNYVNISGQEQQHNISNNNCVSNNNGTSNDLLVPAETLQDIFSKNQLNQQSSIYIELNSDNQSNIQPNNQDTVTVAKELKLKGNKKSDLNQQPSQPLKDNILKSQQKRQNTQSNQKQSSNLKQQNENVGYKIQPSRTHLVQQIDPNNYQDQMLLEQHIQQQYENVQQINNTAMEQLKQLPSISQKQIQNPSSQAKNAYEQLNSQQDINQKPDQQNLEQPKIYTSKNDAIAQQQQLTKHKLKVKDESQTQQSLANLKNQCIQINKQQNIGQLNGTIHLNDVIDGFVHDSYTDSRQFAEVQQNPNGNQIDENQNNLQQVSDQNIPNNKQDVQQVIDANNIKLQQQKQAINQEEPTSKKKKIRSSKITNQYANNSNEFYMDDNWEQSVIKKNQYKKVQSGLKGSFKQDTIDSNISKTESDSDLQMQKRDIRANLNDQQFIQNQQNNSQSEVNRQNQEYNNIADKASLHNNTDKKINQDISKVGEYNNSLKQYDETSMKSVDDQDNQKKTRGQQNLNQTDCEQFNGNIQNKRKQSLTQANKKQKQNSQTNKSTKSTAQNQQNKSKLQNQYKLPEVGISFTPKVYFSPREYSIYRQQKYQPEVITNQIDHKVKPVPHYPDLQLDSVRSKVDNKLRPTLEKIPPPKPDPELLQMKQDAEQDQRQIIQQLQESKVRVRQLHEQYHKFQFRRNQQ